MEILYKSSVSVPQKTDGLTCTKISRLFCLGKCSLLIIRICETLKRTV